MNSKSYLAMEIFPTLTAMLAFLLIMSLDTPGISKH
jgi:hypothetical protein